MGRLSMNNMLSPYDIDNLFNEDIKLTSQKEEHVETPEGEEKKEKENTAEEKVNPDDLFKPESVGSEENIIEGKKDTKSTTDDGGISPNDFYSSIAQSFAEDGVFPDLTEEDFKSITDASTFRELIDKQITAGLTERQRRIEVALNGGVQPEEISELENATQVLNSITEDAISDEGEQGENLRKNLIYQSYINRGFSKDRAVKMVDKSFTAGTDIEDAKDALEDNKDFYQKKYNGILENAKKAKEERVKLVKKQADEFKKSILEDSKAFGDLDIDKNTRTKAYKSMVEPVYKVPETGEYLTEIQKYQRENPQAYLKNVGLLYTLTDGFKNLDKLVKGKVTKEVNKGIKHLESVLKTSGSSGGNFNFVGSNKGTNKTAFSGYSLDV